MEITDKIGYKQYLIDTKLIPDDGYVMKYEYKDITDPRNLYCYEVNTINRIKFNEDGYFDFSKNMIDIGSEYGPYSFILDFNHHYMFEGNKDKCVMSEFNMLLHHKLHKTTCYNVLLSDKVENIKYDGFCTNYTIHTGGAIFDEENANTVQTRTLDSFNLDNIGFIKIDVECMEYQVLKGGIGTIIRNNYPPILFELWDVGYFGMTQEIHDRLVNFLEELGYKILWKWGDFETHLAIH